MRLIIPIVSVGLAIALAAVVWLLEERNLEQAQEISKLKAEVAEKSVQQSFDLKRQCAADADRCFKKWNNAQTPSTPQVGYESPLQSKPEGLLCLNSIYRSISRVFGLSIV